TRPIAASPAPSRPASDAPARAPARPTAASMGPPPPAAAAPPAVAPSPAVAASHAVAASPASAPAPRPKVIVVAPGETLAQLARRRQTSVAALMMFNDMVNTDLAAGARLKLPPPDKR